MPTVSIVMPAYKVTLYIAEAIESILAQTYQDFEIIVVNDGCPDTENLERVLTPYLSRICYIRQENAGPSAARNAGIRAAGGEFIALLDADDSWSPQYLAAQMDYLDRHPEIDVVYPDAIYFGEGPLVGRRFMECCPSQGEVTIASLIEERCCVFISILARRQALLDAGLFDAAMNRAEDFDFWLRILDSGARIGYQAIPLARYRKRITSASVDTQSMLAGQLHAVDKLIAKGRLTPTELAVVETARGRWQVASKLQSGKRALYAGDCQTALADLTVASRHGSSPKLRIAVFFLRLFPSLVRWTAVRLWNRNDEFSR